MSSAPPSNGTQNLVINLTSPGDPERYEGSDLIGVLLNIADLLNTEGPEYVAQFSILTDEHGSEIE